MIDSVMTFKWFIFVNNKEYRKKMDISIPKHCSQEWDKMKPHEGGRFCTICSMFVVDFTKMTRDEITNYKQKTEEKLCARISTYQLTSKSIHKTNLYFNSIKPIERELLDSANYLLVQGYVIDNKTKPITNAKIEFTVQEWRSTKNNETIITESTDNNGKFSFYLSIAVCNNWYIESSQVINKSDKYLLTISKEGFEKHITKVEIKYKSNSFTKLNSKLNLKSNTIFQNSVKTIYGVVYQDLEPCILLQNEH